MFSFVDRTAVDPTKGRPIDAEAGGFQRLTLIPINVNSRQQRAHAALQQQAAGVAMANVAVAESWTYALTGTIFWTGMEVIASAKLRQPESR